MEMFLALCRAPVMEFLFHLVVTSDDQQRSPTLNEQVNCYVMQLFPSGIT